MPPTVTAFPAENLPPSVTREGGKDPNDNDNKPSTIPKPAPADLPFNGSCTHGWSNQPKDLSLRTYFDLGPGASNSGRESKPTIAMDFGLKGPVQPVLRSKKDVVGRDIFLLRDGEGTFYQWFVSEGDMFRLNGIGILAGVVDDADVIRLVMRDSEILAGRCGTQIWNLARA